MKTLSVRNSTRFSKGDRVQLSQEAHEKLIDPRRGASIGVVSSISGQIVTVDWGKYHDSYHDAYLTPENGN